MKISIKPNPCYISCIISKSRLNKSLKKKSVFDCNWSNWIYKSFFICDCSFVYKMNVYNNIFGLLWWLILCAYMLRNRKEKIIQRPQSTVYRRLSKRNQNPKWYWTLSNRTDKFTNVWDMHECVNINGHEYERTDRTTIWIEHEKLASAIAHIRDSCIYESCEHVWLYASYTAPYYTYHAYCTHIVCLLFVYAMHYMGKQRNYSMNGIFLVSERLWGALNYCQQNLLTKNQ